MPSELHASFSLDSNYKPGQEVQNMLLWLKAQETMSSDTNAMCQPMLDLLRGEPCQDMFTAPLASGTPFTRYLTGLHLATGLMSGNVALYLFLSVGIVRVLDQPDTSSSCTLWSPKYILQPVHWHSVLTVSSGLYILTKAMDWYFLSFLLNCTEVGSPR